MGRFLSIIFVIFFISTGILLSWLFNEYFITQTVEEHLIEIPKGSRTADIANKFADVGIVDNPMVFKLFSFLHHKNNSYIQNGEYLFEKGSNLASIFNKVLLGKRLKRYITIPEGYTNHQILQLLNSTDFLIGQAVYEGSEGSLMPDTYQFYKDETRVSILSRMAEQMDKFLENNWQNKSIEAFPHTPKEALKLASIIEKETSIDHEREIVSSVYHNRLKIGMPLQADPTVIYGLKNGKTDFSHILSRKELKLDNPFNTYLIKGLPPTPICNPGKKSIIAALHPAQTDYIYFVADGDGGHKFAKSYNEHLKNVKNYKFTNKSN